MPAGVFAMLRELVLYLTKFTCRLHLKFLGAERGMYVDGSPGKSGHRSLKEVGTEKTEGDGELQVLGTGWL